MIKSQNALQTIILSESNPTRIILNKLRRERSRERINIQKQRVKIRRRRARPVLWSKKNSPVYAERAGERPVEK